MKPLNIVIDTNIWVSLIISAKLEETIDFLLNFNISVHSCKELIEELEDVHNRKKIAKYLKVPVKNYLAFHLEVAEIKKIRLKSVASKDPKDNFLLDLASACEAQYLITGDKELLALKKIGKTRLITLRDFKELFN